MRKPGFRRRSAATPFSALPPMLAEALRRVIRRVRRIFLLRGLLATFATALLALLVIMAVDATTVILDDIWRYLLSGGAWAVTLFSATRRLVIPLSRPFTPVRIAALIERRHPELEERLSTVVELLSGEQHLIGSERLFSVVLETACADVENLDVEQVFTPRTVKPRLVAAAAALGVLTALFILSPRPTGRLFLRALAPFAEVDNLYGGMLTVTPGDTHVIIGSPLDITVIAAPELDGQPFIRFAPPGRIRNETVERMSLVDTRADGSRVFRHLIPAINASFQYRVVSGFAVTRPYQIQATDRPDVTSIHLQMAFPAYTGRQDILLTHSLHNLSAIAGTRLTWTAQYNRSPMQGELRFGERPVTGTAIPGGDLWSTTLTGDGERTWTVLLKDAYGHTNHPVRHTLRIRRDAAPQVAIVSPEARRLELPRFATLALHCVMVDDFGIVSPVVQWAIDDDPFRNNVPITSMETTADPQTWKADIPLELSRFPLAEARQIRFRIQVSDNLPDYLDGPQKTFSEELVVVLNHRATSIAARLAREQGEKIEKALQEVERLLGESGDAAETLEKKQQDGKTSPEALETLEAIQGKIQKADDLARKTATEAQQSLHAPVAKDLARTIKDNLDGTTRQADLATLAEKKDVPEETRALREKLEQSLEAFRTLQKRNEAFAKDLQKLIELDELAMKEAALAAKAEELEKQLQMASLIQEQETLRRELKKPLMHAPATFEVMLEGRRQELDEARTEAVQLANEQEELRQLTEALADPALREAATKVLTEAAPTPRQQTTPDQTVQTRQEDLARRAAELEAKTREIQESLRDWGQPTERAAQRAEEAARALEQAKRQSDEARAKMAANDDAKPKPDPVAAQKEAGRLADAAQEAEKAAARSREQEAAAKARAEQARAEAKKAKNAVRQTAQVKAPADAAKALKLVDAARKAADEAQKTAEAAKKAAEQARIDAATEKTAGAESVAKQMRTAATKAQEAAAQAQESRTQAQMAAEAAKAAEAEARKDLRAPTELQAERQARAREAAAQTAEAARQAQEAEALAKEALSQMQEQAMKRAEALRKVAEAKAAEAEARAASAIERAADAAEALVEPRTPADPAPRRNAVSPPARPGRSAALARPGHKITGTGVGSHKAASGAAREATGTGIST